jgi:hypothetical protein
MWIKTPMTLLVLLLLLGGCAQLDAFIASATERKAPAVAPGVTKGADAVYINQGAALAVADYRNVYIAPANLANMQVIQPEGAAADSEWWVTEKEDGVLQRAIADAFTAALGFESAFYTVATPQSAQILIETAVVAIHPHVTRKAAAADTGKSGAITVSIALVNADTRSSDDIWAFNQVQAGDPAFNPIFRAWGDSIRIGLMQLQGRSTDPLVRSSMVRP